MNVTIRPSDLSGTVSAPPSKSYAHRALICAALSETPCEVNNISRSVDICATLDCIEALGNGTGTYNCRESGSTLRFFAPLSLVSGEKAEFYGSERLIERGISEYENVFADKDIVIEKHAASLILRGKLRAGEYILKGDVSSQFVTGLLLALPLVEGDSIIKVTEPVESRTYIDITLDVLQHFGITVIEQKKNVFYVTGGQKYCGTDFTVEGDWSNTALFMAFPELKVTGLNKNSIQGDRRCTEFFDLLREGKPEIGISDNLDLAPLLMAYAAMNNGATLTGTRRLKLKESDRAETMAQELRKFGADIGVDNNLIYITKRKLHTPNVMLTSHNDHRVVMALTLLCLRYGGTITGAEAVEKSWPEFFDVLSDIGADIC